MDFAGGTPVHICSGSSATAISVYLSRPLFRSKQSSKRTPSHLKLHKPHNINSSAYMLPTLIHAAVLNDGPSFAVLLAMVFIWSCWLPFESGTALALNFKAVMAFCVTQMAAASGSLTWSVLSCTFFEQVQPSSMLLLTLPLLLLLLLLQISNQVGSGLWTVQRWECWPVW